MHVPDGESPSFDGLAHPLDLLIKPFQLKVIFKERLSQQARISLCSKAEVCSALVVLLAKDFESPSRVLQIRCFAVIIRNGRRWTRFGIIESGSLISDRTGYDVYMVHLVETTKLTSHLQPFTTK